MLKPVDADHASVPKPWHSTLTLEPSSTKTRFVNCVGMLLTVATSFREAVDVCVCVCGERDSRLPHSQVKVEFIIGKGHLSVYIL